MNLLYHLNELEDSLTQMSSACGPCFLLLAVALCVIFAFGSRFPLFNGISLSFVPFRLLTWSRQSRRKKFTGGEGEGRGDREEGAELSRTITH